MPIKRLQRFTAGSYSRTRDHKACPASASWKYLNRPRVPSKLTPWGMENNLVPGGELREREGPAIVRGNRIDDLARQYVDGTVKKLPEELALFPTEFKMLRTAKSKGAQPEWAFTREWEPTGWFDADVYYRVKLDFWVRVSKKKLLVIDVKTGKIREGYREQEKAYALGGLLMFPDVEKCDTEYWYLDQGEIIDGSYTRDDIQSLKDTIDHDMDALLSDTKFVPTPGPACRWCVFAKDRGGVCKFSTHGR